MLPAESSHAVPTITLHHVTYIRINQKDQVTSGTLNHGIINLFIQILAFVTLALVVVGCFVDFSNEVMMLRIHKIAP